MLNKLCDWLIEFCTEAAEDQVSRIEREDIPDDQYQQLTSAIRNPYKMNIEIVGSKGEYFASTQTLILDEDQMPEAVDRISLDNLFVYRSVFKNDPMNTIRIVFDFTKPPLFDFVSNPSHSTRNNSRIEVMGQSDTWVSGVYEHIVNTLRTHSTKRAWLHRQSIYDLLLWLFVLPLAFWNLSRIVSAHPPLLQSRSSVLVVFAHIYFLILVLFLFRAFFSYGRWLFPYLELETSIKTVSVKQRLFFLTLAAGLVYSLLQDFVLTIVTAVFGGS